MKKSVLIITSIFSFIVLASLVAAQNLPAPPIAMNDVGNFFQTILNAVLTGPAGGIDMMAKVLVFLLLLVVLLKPSEKIVSGNTKLGLLISAIVSAMAVRFLSDQMVRGLFLPYEALGIVLSVFIPFALFGTFLTISDLSATIRKLGWVMMGGAFGMLWWFRWTDIGDLAWIYLVMGLLCLAALAFDGTLHRLWYSNRIQHEKSRVAYKTILTLRKSINNAIELYPNAREEAEKKALKDSIKEDEKEITELMKQLK